MKLSPDRLDDLIIEFMHHAPTYPEYFATSQNEPLARVNWQYECAIASINLLKERGYLQLLTAEEVAAERNEFHREFQEIPPVDCEFPESPSIPISQLEGLLCRQSMREELCMEEDDVPKIMLAACKRIEDFFPDNKEFHELKARYQVEVNDDEAAHWDDTHREQ